MTTPDETAPARGTRTGALPLSLVALGAAAGALLRWWLGLATSDADFPWVTLAINVSGCFLLAALPALHAVRRSPHLPLLLGPGFLGGFTTVSAWAEETRGLAADGEAAAAGFYVVATLATCVVAAVAGRLLAGSAGGPAAR